MKNILLLFLLPACLTLQAQQKPKPADAESTPLKLVAKLGYVPAGNTGTEIMRRIVDSPLIVVDTKGNKYNVVSFSVNYYFMSSFVEEGTDQKKAVKDFRSHDFYESSSLSKDWAESIKDNVQIGDEMLMNRIIVRLKNGKKMLAPEIRYKVMY